MFVTRHENQPQQYTKDRVHRMFIHSVIIHYTIKYTLNSVHFVILTLPLLRDAGLPHPMRTDLSPRHYVLYDIKHKQVTYLAQTRQTDTCIMNFQTYNQVIP